jgi:hypothetical protein
MVKTRRATMNPMAALSPVMHAGAERCDYRTLSSAELVELLTHARGAGDRFGLTGPERALLYRFAFEAG